MRDFEILFDHGEPPALDHPASRPYGRLGFPPPPPGRPWVFSNFVQSLDGIASFRGKYASGAHLSRSKEDRWLMDLLRAHADAILLGMGTLLEETVLSGGRGPVYEIASRQLLDLRQQLGRGRLLNVFVTGAASIDVSRYRVFDGERVDTAILTTRPGAGRLAEGGLPAHVRVIAAGEEASVDLPRAMGLLRQQLGIRYLLCEGGPTLNGNMSRAGLIDERFLTISPVEVGQMVPPEQEPNELERKHPPRLRPTTFQAPGFLYDTAPWWMWVSCRKVGDHQFSRYRRKT